MKIQLGVIGLVACALGVSAFAADCPNLSGTYKTTVQQDGNTSVDVITITQTGCDEITSVDHFNGSAPSSPMTSKFDGVFRALGSDNTTLLAARWDGNAMVLNFVYASATQDPTALSQVTLSSSVGRFEKEANGNLKVSAVDYDASGKATRNQSVEAIRQ